MKIKIIKLISRVRGLFRGNVPRHSYQEYRLLEEFASDPELDQ